MEPNQLLHCRNREHELLECTKRTSIEGGATHGCQQQPKTNSHGLPPLDRQKPMCTIVACSALALRLFRACSVPAPRLIRTCMCESSHGQKV